MKTITNRRGFPFSTSTLLGAAQQLQGALQDGTLGTPPLVAHLSATFVADFTAQIALVAKLGTDHGEAVGSASSLTVAQTRALADYVHLSARARRIARLTFKGQPTLLSSEFQVGVFAPSGIDSILERGASLVTACQSHAEELAAKNWSPASTEQLETALETLTELNRTQDGALNDKVGLTAQRSAAANLLYEQCVTLQNAAIAVYASATAAADPSTVRAREHFLIGAFPPAKKVRAKAVVQPAPTPTIAGVVALPPLKAAA
jgi:hypothetical protein